MNLELDKLSKNDLLKKCKELKINKYSSKNKTELIELINHFNNLNININNNLTIIDKTIIEKTINNNLINDKKYKFIDLFCGIGGFHCALNRFNNMECVFACDIDENCRNIYEKNYGLKPQGDITKIKTSDIPEFDILCGGFPCQSFSNSGKKKGFDDKRGSMIEYILKIASEKKPSFLFLENVKHIKKIDNGKVFEYILNRIREVGYYVDKDTIFELSPHQLGIPQQRERIIFVCIRKDLYDISKKIVINIPDQPIHLDKILDKNSEIINKYKIPKDIEDILKVWDEIIEEFEVGESLSPTILCNEFYKIYNDEEFDQLPEWKREYIIKNKTLYKKYKEKWDKWYERNSEILQKREINGKLEWQCGKKKEKDSIFNYFIQFRQSGIRVKKNEYFPTLVAIVQTPIYAKERRYITPRECARLQSFPDNFIIHENDHTAYKQFGNAVNVDVVYTVIKSVFDVYQI